MLRARSSPLYWPKRNPRLHLPIGRLKPSNYTVDGASILRWQFLFMLVFLGLVRIPVDAGHQFRSMPGQDSGPCRATVPVDAGGGV